MFWGPQRGERGHVPQFSRGFGQSDEVATPFGGTPESVLGGRVRRQRRAGPGLTQLRREDTQGVFAADGDAAGSAAKAKSEACF